MSSFSVDCGISCKEPTIHVDDRGIFVTAGRTPLVWLVGDSWQALPPAPMPTAMVGGDNLLTPRAAGGFYFTHLLQPALTQDYGELVGLGFHVWDGERWAIQHLWGPQGDAVAPLVDRQWLTEADGGNLLLSYSQPGAGIWLSKSDDGGTTWSAFELFASTGERLVPGGQAGAPHRLDSGAIAIPMTSLQGLVLAVRPDGGETELRPIIPTNPGGLPQVALLGGLVYAAWGGPNKFVAVSTDEGNSWSAPVDLGDDFTPGDGQSNASPWIATQGDSVYVLGLKRTGPWLARLGPDGTVEASWILNATLPDDGNTDHAHFAFGPDGLPCIAWSNDVTVSVACLRATTTDKA